MIRRIYNISTDYSLVNYPCIDLLWIFDGGSYVRTCDFDDVLISKFNARVIRGLPRLDVIVIDNTGKRLLAYDRFYPVLVACPRVESIIVNNIDKLEERTRMLYKLHIPVRHITRPTYYRLLECIRRARIRIANCIIGTAIGRIILTPIINIMAEYCG